MVESRFQKALIKLTYKGIRLVLSTLIVLVFGIFLRDLFLVLVAVMGNIFIGYEVIIIKRKIHRLK